MEKDEREAYIYVEETAISKATRKHGGSFKLKEGKSIVIRGVGVCTHGRYLSGNLIFLVVFNSLTAQCKQGTHEHPSQNKNSCGST